MQIMTAKEWNAHENTFMSRFIAKKYSKYKIIKMLGNEEWEKYKAIMEKAVPTIDLFNNCDYLEEGNEDFEKFIQIVPPEIVERLDECLYDED